MKKITLPKTKTGYVKIDGKVQYVTISEIKIEYINGEDKKRIVITWKYGGKETTSEYDFFPNIYATEYDVINWCPIGHECCIYPLTGNYYVYDDETMNIVSIQRNTVTHILKWDDNRHVWFVEHMCITSGKYEDKELFESEEECRGSIDLVVVEEDGSTHINRSIRSRVSVTQDQMEIIGEIEKLLEKAEKYNVKFFVLGNNLFALNAEEISNFDSSYSYSDLCEPDNFYPCPLNVFMHELKNKIHNLSWEDKVFAGIKKQ